MTMNILTPSVLLSFIVLLGGCAYFDTSEELSSSSADLQATSQEEQVVHSMEPSSARFSRGSVEVFSLDGETPAGIPVTRSSAPLSQDGAVQQQPLDSRIEVAPINSVIRSNTIHGRSAPESSYDSSSTPRSSVVRDGEPVRIYFGNGSSSVDPASRDVIAELVGIVGGNPGLILDVQGYASIGGTSGGAEQGALTNLNVSMRRALSVAAALSESGFPANRIQISAHGEANQPVPEGGMDAEAAARRVEIRPVSVR